MNNNFENKINTEYGNYDKGMLQFNNRTLTPEQLKHLKDIFNTPIMNQ